MEILKIKEIRKMTKDERAKLLRECERQQDVYFHASWQNDEYRQRYREAVAVANRINGVTKMEQEIDRLEAYIGQYKDEDDAERWGEDPAEWYEAIDRMTYLQEALRAGVVIVV